MLVPQELIENYTFRIRYPGMQDAADPEAVAGDATAASTLEESHISLLRNDTEMASFRASDVDFKKSMVKILRTLCLLMQTLNVVRAAVRRGTYAACVGAASAKVPDHETVLPRCAHAYGLPAAVL